MHVNAEHRGANASKACLAVLLAMVVAAVGVGLAAMQDTANTTQAYAEDETTTDATASPVPLVYSLEPENATVEYSSYTFSITPDVEFAFEATENTASSYESWLGDWVVTFENEDSSVSIGDVALIGQYDKYSDGNWFPALLSGVQAGTEYHLMESVYTLLGTGYSGITYKELCEDVDVFKCGVLQSVDSDDGTLNTMLTAMKYNVNIPEGTTMTVELRLYDPSGMQYSGSGTSKTVTSYGNYVTIGSYTYTFGSDDE